ncbi:MAG: CDP-diacylglycerol--serine O-phosphatidyltransferase [Bacteroides sp.]|nr:CDP-diacylglycerol--serine O-phosphatidyltransferase [Bacteroides sp.]
MSIKAHIPNTITCMNLASGILAVIAAFHGSEPYWGLNGYYWTMILIGAAAVFDFCDGAAARLLGAYSPVGKELDSLSDLVSFGVAPTLMVYNIMMENTASWTAYLSLFIAVMGALRLARFNVDDRQTTSFIGLPIPASALFWIGASGWMLDHGYPGDGPVLTLVAFMSLLMVSSLPMFSLKFKNFAWRENFRRYVILAAAVIFVITDGVAGFVWTIILYILISLFGRKMN